MPFLKNASTIYQDYYFSNWRRASDKNNWLENLLWNLENKLGISYSHLTTIIILLQLIILISITSCILCCYSNIINRRKTKKKNGNRKGDESVGNYYLDNIQSVYALAAELDENDNDAIRQSVETARSQAPSHLMRDVLLQCEEISNEDSSANDDELPSCYQPRRSDYFSNEVFHSPCDGHACPHCVEREESFPLALRNSVQDRMILSRSDSDRRMDWVKFDDDETHCDFLSDSDPVVLGEQLGAEKGPQSSEDDDSLQPRNRNPKSVIDCYQVANL